MSDLSGMGLSGGRVYMPRFDGAEKDFQIWWMRFMRTNLIYFR